MRAFTTPRSVSPDPAQLARSVAVGAAAISAILYGLIGLEVVSIGTASNGEATDLLGFGLTTGSVFAISAVLLALVRSRLLWIGFAVLNAVVVVGYFAFASLREPPFELWGLLIKACQIGGFGALAWLAIRGTARHGDRSVIA